MDTRPITLVLGVLLAILAAAMLIPAAVDAALGHADWEVFVAAAGLTGFVGVSLALSSRTGNLRLTVRQAFAVTALSWVVVVLFGALPFVLCDLALSYTDAVFETMSGITTTGATVIVGLDRAPPGVLLWRAILQWLGGIGIIIMAISVLPLLRIGGMQMFRIEAFETEEKVLPRTAQISVALTAIYVVLTASCATALWLAGMSGLDAVAHAMATIATGGFSTYDTSVAAFDSATIDAIITLGMIAGSLPFLLYLNALKGKPALLFHDSQVRVFLGVVAVFVGGTAILLWVEHGMPIPQALRYASFNVISVMTGTGFATAPFDTWGAVALPLFLLVMVIGGCAGSTTCGIKIFRFQVLGAAVKAQICQLLTPHGVFVPYYNHHPIPEKVIGSVLGFVLLYVAILMLLAIGLGLIGLDFLTALSGATTAISNVGPGLGPIIGPAGTFQPLPDSAKWLLVLGMLLGRLELFTVLVVLAPPFWRN